MNIIFVVVLSSSIVLFVSFLRMTEYSNKFMLYYNEYLHFAGMLCLVLEKTRASTFPHACTCAARNADLLTFTARAASLDFLAAAARWITRLDGRRSKAAPRVPFAFVVEVWVPGIYLFHWIV